MTSGGGDLTLSLPLFAGVPRSVATRAVNAARRLEPKAGDRLFAEGEPATGVFVLLTGSVKLIQLTDDGHAIVFRLLGPGDVFGTVSVLADDASYPVSARTVTAAVLLQWPGPVMREFVQSSPPLAMNLLRSVSDRLQALRLQYRQLATESVERRVARAVVRLVHRSGRQVEDGVLIDLPLSREDLGQLTGATLFTVSRIIARWESLGILRARRQQLVIRQLPRLVSIADEAPDV